MVCTQCQQRGGTLGSIRHNYRKFLAPRLCFPNHANGRFTVAAPRMEQHVEVFIWLGIVEQVLKNGDAMVED